MGARWTPTASKRVTVTAAGALSQAAWPVGQGPTVRARGAFSHVVAYRDAVDGTAWVASLDDVSGTTNRAHVCLAGGGTMNRLVLDGKGSVLAGACVIDNVMHGFTVQPTLTQMPALFTGVSNVATAATSDTVYFAVAAGGNIGRNVRVNPANSAKVSGAMARSFDGAGAVRAAPARQKWKATTMPNITAAG